MKVGQSRMFWEDSLEKNCRTKSKPWFSKECALIKEQCRRLAKQLKCKPFDRKIRFDIMNIRKKYKSTLKKNKLAFENNIWSKLRHVDKNLIKSFFVTAVNNCQQVLTAVSTVQSL